MQMIWLTNHSLMSVIVVMYETYPFPWCRQCFIYEHVLKIFFFQLQHFVYSLVTTLVGQIASGSNLHNYTLFIYMYLYPTVPPPQGLLNMLKYVQRLWLHALWRSQCCYRRQTYALISMFRGSWNFISTLTNITNSTTFRSMLIFNIGGDFCCLFKIPKLGVVLCQGPLPKHALHEHLKVFTS